MAGRAVGGAYWRRVFRRTVNYGIALVVACADSTGDRFTTPSPTTRFLQNYPAAENRVYTRAVLWTEEYQRQPRLQTSG